MQTYNQNRERQIGMKFERFGRSWQMQIKTAEDLARLLELDEAHWVATSAPLTSFRADTVFLSYVDDGGEGRITASDLKQAVRWLLARLRDRGGITSGKPRLELSAINTDTAEGKQLYQAARNLLQNVGGRPEAQEIALDTVRQAKASLSEKEAAGDTTVAGSLPVDDVRELEKLILFQGCLLRLANNFVSFPYLYDANERAMFERGTLIMDGRHFNICLDAADPAEHAKVAEKSHIFVLYLQVDGPQDQPPAHLAVPVTAGGVGNLYLGKRGIIKDLEGNQHDVKVVHIVENPISITEAAVTPIRKLGLLLTGKLESITTTAEAKLDASTGKAIEQVKGPQPAPAPGGGHSTGSMLLGGGVALAALGSAWAFVVNTLAGLRWYVVIGGLAGAVLAVMLPTAILAFIKLRRRDLSAILEASGWAINAPLRLTFEQARRFSQRPEYPDPALRNRRRRWLLAALPLLVGVVILIGWLYGWRAASPEQAPVEPVQTQPADAPAEPDTP